MSAMSPEELAAWCAEHDHVVLAITEDEVHTTQAKRPRQVNVYVLTNLDAHGGIVGDHWQLTRRAGGT